MAEIHSRVTLADLAKATGLHYSSVSLALRDSPKIPVHTRDKVKAVARKMGYRNVFSIMGGYKALVTAQWPMKS